MLVAQEEWLRQPQDGMLGATLGQGRFQVVGKLGQGAMGAVYRARQKLGDGTIRRDVALKVIQATSGFSLEEARARFFKEAAAVSQLTHPGVVTLHDFWIEADGTHCMAMELVPGVTLAEALATQRLTMGRFLEAIRLVLDALQAAHQARPVAIVHRDLKPANIMLRLEEEGEEPTLQVKVLDFGLVKILGSQPVGLRTSGARVFGTPAYMSPEQIFGPTVDGRADLYSLSIILYEGLAGHPPFRHPHDFRLVLPMHQFRRPPPFLPAAGVPPALEQVVRRGLEKQPEQRWGSAAEMKRALAALELGDAAGARLPVPWLPTEPSAWELCHEEVERFRRQSLEPEPGDPGVAEDQRTVVDLVQQLDSACLELLPDSPDRKKLQGLLDALRQADGPAPLSPLPLPLPVPPPVPLPLPVPVPLPLPPTGIPAATTRRPRPARSGGRWRWRLAAGGLLGLGLLGWLGVSWLGGPLPDPPSVGSASPVRAAVAPPVLTATIIPVRPAPATVIPAPVAVHRLESIPPGATLFDEAAAGRALGQTPLELGPWAAEEGKMRRYRLVLAGHRERVVELPLASGVQVGRVILEAWPAGPAAARANGSRVPQTGGGPSAASAGRVVPGSAPAPPATVPAADPRSTPGTGTHWQPWEGGGWKPW